MRAGVKNERKWECHGSRLPRLSTEDTALEWQDTEKEVPLRLLMHTLQCVTPYLYVSAIKCSKLLATVALLYSEQYNKICATKL